MHQRNFFPLPSPRKIEVTREQLAVLDLIALRDGTPLGELATGERMVLRNLLAAELVHCIAMGPSRYKLTAVGRLVRGRSR